MMGLKNQYGEIMFERIDPPTRWTVDVEYERMAERKDQWDDSYGIECKNLCSTVGQLYGLWCNEQPVDARILEQARDLLDEMEMQWCNIMGEGYDYPSILRCAASELEDMEGDDDPETPNI